MKSHHTCFTVKTDYCSSTKYHFKEHVHSQTIMKTTSQRTEGQRCRANRVLLWSTTLISFDSCKDCRLIKKSIGGCISRFWGHFFISFLFFFFFFNQEDHLRIHFPSVKTNLGEEMSDWVYWIVVSTAFWEDHPCLTVV